MNECSIDDCERKRVARGWCHTHYEMWRRHGDPLAGRKYADNSGGCSADGCTKKARAKSLCDAHYTRLRLHGSADIILVRRGWSVEQRFDADIDRASGSSCWIWRGPLDSSGYGMIYVSHGRFLRAHRYSYQRFVGAIPDGWDVDHLCRKPACANPAHLQAVTHAVNCLRGIGIHAQNARKTHCKHGHEFTPANTHRTPEGFRRCRACNRDKQRRRRAASTPQPSSADR
jgi:hypothetical protein